MRILITSFAFPPFNCVGSLRVGKTAKYLSVFGHDVRVVTAGKQPFPPNMPVEVSEQNIVYTKWLNLREPARVVLRESLQNIPGNTSPKSRAGSLLKKNLGVIYRTLMYFPDPNIGWVPYALRASARLVKDWKPDVILASAPPPSSLVVAHKLSRKYGIPWVADLRDLWVDHHYYSQPSWRKPIEAQLERRVLSSAAGLITVSEPWAETLRIKYKKPTTVVLNAYDPHDYPPPETEAPKDARLRILYPGVIYPGKQDPSPLFEALLKLGRVAEQIRVDFYGFYQTVAKELVAKYGLGHIVHLNPVIAYKDCLRMQTEADVLLLLLWNDPSERGVYPAKVFEYIGARRPILAVGQKQDAAAELVGKLNAGEVSNDPSEIAMFLERWIQQKRLLGEIPRLSKETGAGLTREEQTRILEHHLMQVCGQN